MWSKPAHELLPLSQLDLQPAAAGVLVTGATGFVGRHIVTRLLSQGYTVTALIRPEKFGGSQSAPSQSAPSHTAPLKPTGSQSASQQSAEPQSAGSQSAGSQSSDPRLPEGCIQIPVAITDVERLIPIVAACDAVIYAAGSVRGGRLQDFWEANEAGLEALLRAMDRAGAKLPTLLISSLAASCPELSDYSLSKFNGEQHLAKHPQLPWTIFRPPAIYGPGDKEMLPILNAAAKGWVFNPGPVHQRLSLLHVEDLARAVLAWVRKPGGCTHQTYAFDDGTPQGYDWPAMAEGVGAEKYRIVRIPRALLAAGAQLNLLSSRLFSYAPMLTPGKVRELTRASWLCEDNARFELATGWRPQLNLRAGWQRLKSSFNPTNSG